MDEVVVPPLAWKATVTVSSCGPPPVTPGHDVPGGVTAEEKEDVVAFQYWAEVMEAV